MLADIDSYHRYYDHLKGIEDYVRSASDLTKQLLAFARGGKYQVNPMNLNELTRKSSEMFGRTKKEITIHSKSQEGLWTVEADSGQIEQVLLNLYVNAWHAMPDGGDIYINTKNVTHRDIKSELYEPRPGKYVRITVADNGIGIDMEYKDRVFVIFQRLHTRRHYDGTGMGLSYCKKIVEGLGGRIWLKSAEGEGATFYFTIPERSTEDE